MFADSIKYTQKHNYLLELLNYTYKLLDNIQFKIRNNKKMSCMEYDRNGIFLKYFKSHEYE